MTATALLVGLLALELPAPLEKLEVSDVRAVYGLHGADRAKAIYYPPQDGIAFKFTLRGVAIKEQKVQLDVRTQLIDAQGEAVQVNTLPIRALVLLKGDRFPGFAFLPLGGPVAPGEYTCRVNVRDLNSGAQAKFEEPVSLRPVEFAVTAAWLSLDPEGKHRIRPQRLTVGQAVFAHLSLIGMDVSKPTVEVLHRVEMIDAVTKESLMSGERPLTFPTPPNPPVTLNLQCFPGMLTRPGKFILRHTVTDKANGNLVVHEVPLVIASDDE